MTASPPFLYDARGLQVELGGRLVLGPIDVKIARGSFLGLLGPNGSGKTTLLRALSGGIKLKAGTLSFEDRPITDYRAADLAHRAGVVPQTFNLDFNFTVSEMVAMGRYARGEAAADGEAVTAALEATGMAEMSDRLVTELSGGERQRALIAQTLAQQTPTLLLDEPLNNLDLNHQLEIMQLLRSLHQQERTIIVVLHDLNMAAQYCDELLLLKDGECAARGEPSAVLDPRVILEVFKARVVVHREGKRPYVTPLWSGFKEETAGERMRVHVVAGGGAASPLLEELVSHGFTPTVGIVSVFDTDYTTAQRYELDVVSAPPFQAFPPETVQEQRRMIGEADAIIVAPVFFGPGNLAQLETVIEASRGGKKVIVMDQPPIQERDLSQGEATRLIDEIKSLGAVDVRQTDEARLVVERPSD